ncbi:acyl-CoA thioesterase [filamentous cyanobacterium LEGE 11480]|uniref:1,4-dihydroxy-2-naphthoyl-CoA hydrolase n=1 Tax=Romeriopsis navalis LEGE 11480 TaxID=2777977 RepID=A0A928VMK1_9CYAN|nr:thioesterase family protein [Romeriopsis navalis]MBE9031311.1 acyl-CoA thioesterase [Romeriopsis navalis LEGE 11480]
MTFIYQRTVRFGDTDAAGVVYFANVLSICHEAYEAALINLGVDARSFFRGEELAVPIVHGEVDFHRPMRCGDQLHIRVLPVMTTASEFEIRYEVLIEGFDRPVSRALTRHVCIDVQTRKRILIPAMLKQWIEAEAVD